MGDPDSQTGLPGRTLMAIYMGDILIQGSFPPQVHLYAQGATLLFMVLGWSLIWVKDVSFPNLLATHLDLYPSWHVFACSISLVLDSVRIILHTTLYSAYHTVQYIPYFTVL